MDDKSKINKLILKSAYILIIVLIIAVIALIILKYNVEGEKNMPFKMSSIILLSSAEGNQDEENNEYNWDTEIYQNNDIYINIERNKNYKETEAIDRIIIDNIKLEESPRIGTIELYRPSNEDLQVYTYEDSYKIGDSIEYIGDVKSDIKNLKISNQGSTLIFRVVNKTGKRYSSNEEEFKHDGKLLNKVGISYEDIKATISFDLTIKLESDISFKTNIKLDIPVGDLIKEGSSSLEITDTRDFIFKRQ